MCFLDSGWSDQRRTRYGRYCSPPIWCSISDDKAAAEDALKKKKLRYYGHALSPTILEQLGLTHQDFIEIRKVVMVEQDVKKPKINGDRTDDANRHCRTAKDLIARLEKVIDMGVNHISLGHR